MEMKQNIFSTNHFLIILIYYFITITLIQLSYTLPCTTKDFNYRITNCDDDKRKVFFSYTNQCDTTDIASQALPTSILNAECLSCPKGHALKYNFDKAKLLCEPCPLNTYSNAGQFRINGEHREWSDATLQQFTNKCFVFNSKHALDKECKGFSSNEIYIHTNNAYNNNEYDYVAQLSLNIKIVRKGEIRFKYRTENIVENGYLSGIFRFYINYKTAVEHYSNKSEWKEAKIPLEIGSYSFLWQYMKFVSSIKTQRISLKISLLEIDGIETAALECSPCLGGTSMPMASYCNYCTEGKYHDTDKLKCIQCPPRTYSPYKSIGIESCEKIPNCTDNSYQIIISSICNTKLNQQRVHYDLIQMKCIEITTKEDSVIPCIECPIGKYWNPIANDIDNSKCEVCPLNKYSSKPNQNSCSPCEGIMSRVTYMKPEDKKSSKMNFEIDIEDFDGEISVSFTQIESTKEKETKADILIDNTIVKTLTDYNKNEKIPIKIGNHNVKINSMNTILNMVTITNTKNGGGYVCRPCTNGILFKKGDDFICQKCGAGYELNFNGQCKPCSEGSYKKSIAHKDKCIKCPLYTQPNKQRNHCEPYDVITQSRYRTRINLGKYHLTQLNLCKLTNNMCKDNLYGPIKDMHKNLYFISYDKATNFIMDDFTYKFNEQQESSSFIYQLINDNTTINTSSNDGMANSKIVISLGRDISSIKILNGDSAKGIMMTYSNGDVCLEDSTKKYQTVLYFACLNNENKENNEDMIMDDITTSYSPTFINKSNCVYYFKWPSKGICPICLKSQVNKIVTPCKGFNRTVYYTERDNCIISNTTGFSGRNISIDDDNAMISNENDQAALKEYDIHEQFISKPIQIPSFENNGSNSNSSEKKGDYPILKNTEDIYIEATKLNEVCYMYEDYDKHILIIIIVIPIVYIIIAIIFICVCCKYRKIQGDYHRLVEDPINTNGDNANNSQINVPHHIDQEVELGSVHQDKNKNNSDAFDSKPPSIKP